MEDIFGGLAACQSEEPDALAALKRRCDERSKERVAIFFFLKGARGRDYGVNIKSNILWLESLVCG